MTLIPEERLKTFSSYYWLHDDTFATWIVGMLAPYGQSILDVGCGDGTLIPRLASAFTNVVAIDPDRVLGERANQTARQHGATFYQAQAESIPFGDDEFDIAVAKSSLHHFESEALGIREMDRVSQNLVAVVEVVAPTSGCLTFLMDILPRKEAGRRADSIYTMETLGEAVRNNVGDCTCQSYLYDQLIDIEVWLDNSGLPYEERREIREAIQSVGAEVRADMRLHVRSGRLVMLRRMCLCMAIKTDC